MIRHITDTWPAWIAVAISVVTIAVAAGGLLPRIAYCESQIVALARLPVQVARVEARLDAQTAQLDRIERSLVRHHEDRP